MDVKIKKRVDEVFKNHTRNPILDEVPTAILVMKILEKGLESACRYYKNSEIDDLKEEPVIDWDIKEDHFDK